MHLVQHILEVLALEVAQDAHARALHLLDVAHDGRAAIVGGDHAVHERVEALLAVRVHAREDLVQGFDAVVQVLQAVVQVRELVCLAADAACEHVAEHLGDVVDLGLWGFDVALLVGLLFVTGLRGVHLLLVVGLLVDVDWFVACVRDGRGHDELVHFKGVGVLAARG